MKITPPSKLTTEQNRELVEEARRALLGMRSYLENELDRFLGVPDPCSDPMPHNPGVSEKRGMCVGSFIGEACYDGFEKPVVPCIGTTAEEDSEITKGLARLALDLPELSRYVRIATEINDEAECIMGSLLEVAREL